MNYILIGKLYENFYVFENTIKYHLNKILTEIHPDFLTTTLKANLEKNIFPADYLEDFPADYLEDCLDKDLFQKQGLMSELGLVKSIRTDEASKLPLGFYIQLFKWKNVIRLCKELNIYEYQFLDILFKKEWRETNLDYMIKSNELYADFTNIQNYRNEFCHFRLNNENYTKINEINDLLSQYNQILN